MTDLKMKTGPIAELDLSGERPLVLVDGEALTGVSSTVLEIDAFETPVLILQLVRFDVKGGELPCVMPWRYRAEGE